MHIHIHMVTSPWDYSGLAGHCRLPTAWRHLPKKGSQDHMM